MANLNAGCTVALYRGCNHATNTPKNATTNATEAKHISLKALAMGVLERNARNSPRNLRATDELRSPQNSATQNQSYETYNMVGVLQQYELIIDDIIQAADEDWADVKDNTEALNSIAILITDTRLRQQGKVPPSYTAKASCKGCGNVYLPPALASVKPLLGCPWCFNRAGGLPIPQYLN
jgi:hypothetical protein